MRKFLSGTSDAVTKSATHVMRQAKAAALANAIKETQARSSSRSTGTSVSIAASSAPPVGPRPLVGISSPLNRGATALAQKSRSEWLASRQEELYTMQKPLSAAELYRQARFSGQITPTLAINEIGAEEPKVTTGGSIGSSCSGGSSNLPHYLFYSVVLTLTGAAAWLCLDHTPLHTSESQALLHANFSRLQLVAFEAVLPAVPGPSISIGSGDGLSSLDAVSALSDGNVSGPSLELEAEGARAQQGSEQSEVDAGKANTSAVVPRTWLQAITSLWA